VIPSDRHRHRGACAAPASLADERGELLWSGQRFRPTASDLELLWTLLPQGTSPSQITIVMEPTRNAWVPLAGLFRRQSAQVVLASVEHPLGP
jgi:hypothetical protein